MTMPPERVMIADQVEAERRRQDRQWGGKVHDDLHDLTFWPRTIKEHADRATKALKKDGDEYRKQLIEIAALAFAAVERLDRASGTVPHAVAPPPAPPIPMILFCPMCGARHVEGEFANKSHHTHACQTCGMAWRPAIEATAGVQFLPGFKDGAK